MKILIISGGNSSEREISLISADAVKKALEKKNHEVQIYDLAGGYAELKNVSQTFDCLFPVIHGREGEGGQLHKFLASLGVPYVGGNWESYEKYWAKLPFKKYCNENNILTSDWREVKTRDDISTLGFPVVLKASNGGSSREVVVLKTAEDLDNPTVQELLDSIDELFIEKFVKGIEVTVAILDNKALPVIEIKPPEGRWFNYQTKYSGETKEIPDAPSLSKKEKESVQAVALKIHQDLELGPYSRIDFIVSEGKPYVLEINTIPGLTSESLFPKAAAAAGYSFPEVIQEIIDLTVVND